MKAQLLGKGSFGAAFLATSKRDGKKYVLKEIDISRMQKKEREAAEQEAKVPFQMCMCHTKCCAMQTSWQMSSWVCCACGCRSCKPCTTRIL